MYGIGVCYQYSADLVADSNEGVHSPCANEELVDVENSVSGEFGVCEAGMGLDAQVCLRISVVCRTMA